jgi:nitroreductase
MGPMIAGVQERVASITASHDVVRDAIAVARLAPSSHNSQPWAVASFETPEAVRVLGDWLGVRPRSDERWLVVALDAERALKALPSLATEMRLSGGMFLQLLVARLAEAGLAVRVIPCEGKVCLPPLAGYPAAWTPLAAVAVSPGAPRLPEWLTVLAPQRRTNRAPYEDRSVETDAQRDLAGSRALFDSGADRGAISVTLISAPGTIRAIGDFVGEHASVDFTDRTAWRETYRYMRFSARSAAAKPDGFALTQLFGPLPPLVPLLLRLALSPPAMRVLRAFGAPAVMARGLGRLVGAAPLLACISVDSASPWTELVAGGVALDLWMRATSCGLALHPVSAILQHDEIRERFQRFIPKGRAVFFARVGYPTTAFPPTSRRDLETSGWARL